jgi:hypothetical protein
MFVIGLSWARRGGIEQEYSMRDTRKGTRSPIMPSFPCPSSLSCPFCPFSPFSPSAGCPVRSSVSMHTRARPKMTKTHLCCYHSNLFRLLGHLDRFFECLLLLLGQLDLLGWRLVLVLFRTALAIDVHRLARPPLLLIPCVLVPVRLFFLFLGLFFALSLASLLVLVFALLGRWRRLDQR